MNRGAIPALLLLLAAAPVFAEPVVTGTGTQFWSAAKSGTYRVKLVSASTRGETTTLRLEWFMRGRSGGVMALAVDSGLVPGAFIAVSETQARNGVTVTSALPVPVARLSEGSRLYLFLAPTASPADFRLAYNSKSVDRSRLAFIGTVKVRPDVPRVALVNRLTPGAAVDLGAFLVSGKTVLFDCYSDYCGPCLVLAPYLERLVASREGLLLRKLDVNRPGVKGIDWGSPLARQYRLQSLPHFKIYDGQGRLLAEGDEARNMVSGWFDEAGITD